jgi:molecular chaperone DnaJ
MNIQEAYKILESSENISDDDLKKKWKSLAKKYHPDINKENPDKFKQINSAYQQIQDYRKNPPQQGMPFNMADIFQGFSGFRQDQGPPPRNVSHITIDQNISFEESILGTEKEIEIDRDVKCDECNGQTFKQKKNNCTHCDGFGHSSVQRGNMIMNTLCSQCHGQSTKEECLKCNKKGFSKSKTKMKVKIPAGVSDKNIIQLQGAGHYSHSSIFGDAHSNILMTINVKNDTQLKLDGADVICNLNISLLEALEGCSKTVPSIKGDQNIEVPADSRNKEEIILKNLGVNLQGNERVILDVSYPKNKEKLISILKEGN